MIRDSDQLDWLGMVFLVDWGGWYDISSLFLFLLGSGRADV